MKKWANEYETHSYELKSCAQTLSTQKHSSTCAICEPKYNLMKVTDVSSFIKLSIWVFSRLFLLDGAVVSRLNVWSLFPPNGAYRVDST
jgi:hypothetical protein